MVTSKKHSEPQPGKRPPVEIHSITFQLSDPDNPPESLELDERFTFLRDYPSYQIQAGDRLFGFDKVETLKKSRQDLMTLIARWPKSCSTLVWACLNQSGILTQPSPHLPAECVMPSVWFSSLSPLTAKWQATSAAEPNLRVTSTQLG